MPHPDIATALVTELPLIWLVRFTGLAMAAGLLFFVIDANRQFNLGKDREP
jgi:hypothetical protein